MGTVAGFGELLREGYRQDVEDTPQRVDDHGDHDAQKKQKKRVVQQLLHERHGLVLIVRRDEKSKFDRSSSSTFAPQRI